MERNRSASKSERWLQLGLILALLGPAGLAIDPEFVAAVAGAQVVKP
jgi:hypothetical protein